MASSTVYSGLPASSPRGDRTQTGHVLGDPARRDNPDTLDTKNMSPGPFTLVRMLTHMAMLLGASINQQVLYPTSNHSYTVSTDTYRPYPVGKTATLLARLYQIYQCDWLMFWARGIGE